MTRGTNRRDLLRRATAVGAGLSVAGCGETADRSTAGPSTDASPGQAPSSVTGTAGAPTTAAGVESRLDAIESRQSDFESLLSAAESADLPTDYQRVHFTTVERFVGYGRDDLANDHEQRAAYVAQECERLQQEAIEDLEAALEDDGQADDGWSALARAPRYRTSDVTVDGHSFLADSATETGDGGEKPTFFTGYGHFSQVRQDVPHFQDFGHNAIQTAIRPTATIDRYEDGEFVTRMRTIENRFIPLFENAEEHDVSVNILLAPHILPEFVFEEFDVENANPGFLGFDVFHPKVRELYRAHIDTAIPAIQDFDSLHSITLSNEPIYQYRDDERTRREWATFLARRHDAIETLNRRYSTDHDGFGDVPPPEIEYSRTVGELPGSAKLYDWARFNNERFAGWHEFLADLVHEHAPDLPVHTKMMGRTIKIRSSFLIDGIDPAEFTDFCAINGNDNWNYLDRRDHHNYTNYVKFYDLQSSLQSAPIFNSEDHLIRDGNTDYGPQTRKHVRMSRWQGAIHGCGASTMWIWKRTDNESSGAYGGILHRPDCVVANGRTHLDLNRLASEVTAFQEAPADVAILYSLPATVHSEPQNAYFEWLDAAYRGFSYSGAEVDFVSEAAVQDGALAAYPLFVLPNVQSVERATADAIAGYAESGDGEILLVGDESAILRRDAYGQSLEEPQRSTVLDAATTIDGGLTEQQRSGAIPNAAFRTSVRERLRAHDRLDVVVRTPAGDVPRGVEWRSVSHDGRLLVNLTNVNTAPITVDVYGAGEPIDGARDVLNRRNREAPFELDELEPTLLSLSK
jgi:hypothetical protein